MFRIQFCIIDGMLIARAWSRSVQDWEKSTIKSPAVLVKLTHAWKVGLANPLSPKCKVRNAIGKKSHNRYTLCRISVPEEGVCEGAIQDCTKCTAASLDKVCRGFADPWPPESNGWPGCSRWAVPRLQSLEVSAVDVTELSPQPCLHFRLSPLQKVNSIRWFYERF